MTGPACLVLLATVLAVVVALAQGAQRFLGADHRDLAMALATTRDAAIVTIAVLLAIATPQDATWVRPLVLPMALGTLAIAVEQQARNFVLFVMQNDTYEITGNQPVPGAAAVDISFMVLPPHF